MEEKKQRFDTSIIVAITAVIISVCALVVSIQEVRIMRTQQKISLYPYLTISNFFNSDSFGLSVKNSGSGLAKINSYQISDGEKYFKDWLELINYYAPEGHQINYNVISSNKITDEMITPGERIDIISIPWNDQTRALLKKLDDLKIKICYSSLLDDHWQIENSNTRIELEKPCRKEEGKEFLN